MLNFMVKKACDDAVFEFHAGFTCMLHVDLSQARMGWSLGGQDTEKFSLKVHLLLS